MERHRACSDAPFGTGSTKDPCQQLSKHQYQLFTTLKTETFSLLCRAKRISKSSCILSEFSKKKRKTKKLHHPFLFRGCRWASLPSAECQSSLFEFWRSCWISSLFASYFVLHNNYIRILSIHGYKSSWRCRVLYVLQEWKHKCSLDINYYSLFVSSNYYMQLNASYVKYNLLQRPFLLAQLEMDEPITRTKNNTNPARIIRIIYFTPDILIHFFKTTLYVLNMKQLSISVILLIKMAMGTRNPST